MGAYFTQVRRIPHPFTSTGWENGVRTFHDLDRWYSPSDVSAGSSEVTTSYRSGGRAVGLDMEQMDDDEAILSASSYAERFKALHDQEQRSTASIHDNGHTFASTKRYVRTTMSGMCSFGGGIGWGGVPLTRYGYLGPIYSDPQFHSQVGSQWISKPFDQGYYGPAAIKRTAPTNPVADLAVSLAELKREGLPSLPGFQTLQGQTSLARKSGGEYLNVEFGWKPLVGAIGDTMDAVSRSGAILRQYQRDSGKPIRRRTSFPIVRTVDVFPERQGELLGHYTSTAYNNIFKNGIRRGTLTETVETSQRVWFSGAYTYFLQTGDGLTDRMKQFEEKANHLLGTRITPEVLWNLAPWSWLSDWNINIGDNLANASALSSDGLVIKWGYLMCETSTHHTASIVGPELINGFRGPFVTTWTQVSKERVKARPYGFGSKPESYTNRQWAILGALGLTKAPKALFD